MTSSTVNICVLALVLLSFQQICLSRPHSRSKRGLVKHYFVPDTLVFPQEKFERGEDGKYYLKKSAHRSDSEVKYVAEEGANALLEDVKASHVEQGDKPGNEKTELPNKEITETLVTEQAFLKPTPPVVEKMKVVEAVDLPKSEAIVEKATKKDEIDSEKAPFTPVDPKFVVPPKPDSKDEIPLKTDLPPIDVEEKVDEKIAIGQVPHMYPRVIPVPGNFRLPVLIPVRKVSYGAVSVIPVPPVDGSDRLPLPFEDDIVGEGPHESDIVGEGPHESEPDEVISQPVSDEKKDTRYNPLMGVHLPFLSFRTFLQDLKDADKQNREKQSKVVDVLGKKFLMQSSVMKHPTGDDSHMYVRFLSVKPLEEIKPKVLKGEAETVEKDIQQAKREGTKELEVKKEAEILKEEESLKESEAVKEAEVLKAEETQIKMEVDHEVPKEVILENMGRSDMNMGDNIEDSSLKEMPVKGEMSETNMEIIEDSFIASDESISTTRIEEPVTESPVGKVESEVSEKRMDSALIVEPEGGEGKVESKESTVYNEEPMPQKDEEIKVDSTDALKKGDIEKAMIMESKNTHFLVEKNKKQKSMEESEEHKKSKKKSEKKKKKCKCEEKDSDSDDDDE